MFPMISYSVDHHGRPGYCGWNDTVAFFASRAPRYELEDELSSVKKAKGNVSRSEYVHDSCKTFMIFVLRRISDVVQS